METRDTMKSPMPKSSAISKGFSLGLGDDELADDVLTLNCQGNCHEGKPSSTSPVKINASFLPHT